eukprot:10207746-Alexandrium_andersonii.AAC.1
MLLSLPVLDRSYLLFLGCTWLSELQGESVAKDVVEMSGRSQLALDAPRWLEVPQGLQPMRWP